MKDVLWGWGEIAKHLGLHPRTAQRYERTRSVPVHRPPGGGPKAPVFARKSELDDWLLNSKSARADIDVSASRDREPSRVSARSADLAVPILDRIMKVARDTKLYRRDYVLRFDLRRSIRGVQAKVQCEFELCNATDEKQPYVQEVTVDDCDHGYVERMSFSVNGQPAYTLKKPAAVKKLIGYAVYHGPEQMIEPSAKGVTYLCHAYWVINRNENDIWYNHLALPTVGIEVETHAPPDFEITPSFSRPDLVMTAEHIDIAWNRRRMN